MSSVLDLRPSLAGKVALVTGGMGGIGRECVRVLHAHGVRVAFSFAEGHDEETHVQETVNTDPNGLSAHALDLRSFASVQRCIDQASKRWGRIDVLINNAAVGSATVAAYANNPAEQDAVMLDINANGTLTMCQEFLRTQTAHTDQPKKIINIASVGGGVQAFSGFRLSDGMSKAAVAFLTRQLAAEHVHDHVDVFAICPGATNTSMLQQSTLNAMDATQQAAFIHALPKRRLIEPLEVANLVAFLASAHSGLLHGAVIDASMGLGVRPGLMTEQQH